jgi:hypothetical protein
MLTWTLIAWMGTPPSPMVNDFASFTSDLKSRIKSLPPSVPRYMAAPSAVKAQQVRGVFTLTVFSMLAKEVKIGVLVSKYHIPVIFVQINKCYVTVRRDSSNKGFAEWAGSHTHDIPTSRDANSLE